MEIPHFFPAVALIMVYWTKASFTSFPTKSRIKTISKAITAGYCPPPLWKDYLTLYMTPRFVPLPAPLWTAIEMNGHGWITHGWRLSLESWLTRWIMQPVESPSHQSSCLNTPRLRASIGTRGGVCFYGYQSVGVFWIPFSIFGLREFSWSSSQ